MTTHQSRRRSRAEDSSSDQDSSRAHNERLLKELRPGDIVKFARFRGIFYHFVIYIGNEMVVHVCELEDVKESDKVMTSLSASVSSAPKNKVRIAEESFWKAAKNCKGYKANNERYECEGVDVDEVLSRAKMVLGRTDYHFLLKNCEHWVNKIKYDREESTQVKDFSIGVGVTGAILGLGALGLIAYGVNKSRNKNTKTRDQSLQFA